MNVPPEMVPHVLGAALRGMARLQARQEMLECIVRAVIVSAPPMHPLMWQALHTAKSDMESRLQRSRPADETPPEVAADAMALWNEMWTACKPLPGRPPSTDVKAG